MSIAQKVAVVIGVGPGIGNAVAIKFASQGYSVALVSRTKSKLELIQADIEKAGGKAITVVADASNEASLRSAFSTIRSSLGHPEVLVYNVAASPVPKKGILELTVEKLENDWKLDCLGAFIASNEVLDSMQKNKKGTIIFTGATASLRGGSGFAAFAIGKFGLRALSQSMAREVGPNGVHVAHVIVDGLVDLAHTKEFVKLPEEHWIKPAAIAEQYWNLHQQPPNAWTQELDIRPNVEKW